MLKDPRALVVLDGTEIIDERQYKGKDYEWIFIPKSVTIIKEHAFEDCKNLKEVVFEEGSKLEKIGYDCFNSSGLEEITLPRTLKNVGFDTFTGCKDLKTIYVEDGCKADLSDLEIQDSA